MLEHAYPVVRAPTVQFIWLLAFVLIIVTLYLIPDGRFVPRSTRLLAIVAVVLVVLSPGLPEGPLRLPPAQQAMSAWHWRVAVLGVLALWCSGLAAQVYRYRRVSGPVERQQAKWVMFIFGIFMAIIALGIVIPSLLLELPATSALAEGLAAPPCSSWSSPTGPGPASGLRSLIVERRSEDGDEYRSAWSQTVSAVARLHVQEVSDVVVVGGGEPGRERVMNRRSRYGVDGTLLKASSSVTRSAVPEDPPGLRSWSPSCPLD